MKSSAKDNAEGAFHKAKSQIKKIHGRLSHIRDLEAEGAREKKFGEAQKKIGHSKNIFGK